MFLDTKAEAARPARAAAARPWRSYLEVDVAGDGGGMLE